MSKYLNYEERLEIERGLKEHTTFAEIGRRLNKDRTTISKEIRNYAVIRCIGYADNPHNTCKSRKYCKKRAVCGKENCQYPIAPICRKCNFGCNRYCIHNRLIRYNPCDGVEVPKTKAKPIRVLSQTEEQEILEEAKGRIYENLIIVALGTGLRIGELMALNWCDIDFSRREIYINKTLVHIKNLETNKYYFSYQEPKTKNSTRVLPMKESV